MSPPLLTRLLTPALLTAVLAGVAATGVPLAGQGRLDPAKLLDPAP